jgi:hypothetical protein
VSLATQVSALATAIGNTLRDSYKPRLLPAGGTAGQVLAKNTANNYDAGWVAASQDIIRALTADAVGTNVATAQPLLPGAAAINLAAATSYEFRALAEISRAAGTTSHTTGVLFGGTATLTSIDYTARISNPTGNVLGAVQEIRGLSAALLVLTAANIVATEDLRIELIGVVRTTLAGTFIPQFQYSAIPGGVPTVKRNSFIRLTPLGSNTVAAVN